MNKNRVSCIVYHLSCIVCCLFFVGCFAPSLIKEQKGIFVSIFKNNTKEYSLSNELNLVLVDEIMKGRNFIIENKGADLILKGSILDYKKTPIAWDKDMNIREYKLNITVEFELFDKTSLIQKETLFSSIIYSKNDNEREERERLLRRTSRSIVNRLKI